jgi:hypothetical protein
MVFDLLVSPSLPFCKRSNEEVGVWDTVQEKLSFSDRFGLTLTFEPANQDTYLHIVRHLATLAGITISEADLDSRALQWATRHNGRSGRTARQFVDFLQAEMNYPAASGRGIKIRHRDNCSFRCNWRYSFPCFLTYLAIIPSSPCLPTVVAKYPSLQNSPPHNCFLT